MDLQLHGRVVLVVGGTGLIGGAVVERLAAEGATPIVASRRGTGGIELDARDDASVNAAIARVLKDHGRLDGVVVAAAPSAQTLDPTRNSDPAQVLEAIDAKALAFLRVANASLRVMTEAGYGRIVGISGQNAFVTGNVTGAVRNAALIIAAKNLADSVAGTGVTVNTVSPGIVSENPVADVAHGKAGESRPADIANLVTYLISPVAGAVSGESIAVGHRVRGTTSL
ncbi:MULTISPECIES: SDR family NAD(P)-dependent oxidoreductase [unclassified Leifsonia]|uniref:SDR family NAD(P)-dependent oxidoreductase n=1 Tax=unclassified Leifsonia TaxID=2663824 RepID=UPI0006FB633B|nr:MULTISPECIES: SDR family oxidoreductase [unclassified Leifsonia]KQX07640.1 dehydrogenase [Leifsonia sp. Root1293]KRA11922.1 dehydrogenase [Leifsonia sp. Root60]